MPFPQNNDNPYFAKSAFTLVELAIVLVIIGLIVGGILTGQSLVKAAEINNTIARLEKTTAAAVTFRGKYGGLPGDLIRARASMFGFVARSGAQGHGDGNDLIEGCGWREAALGCETALFWMDLTRAQMISDSFTTANSISDGDSIAASVTSPAVMKNYLPALAPRDTAFVHVFPESDRNYYLLADMTTDASGDIQFGASKAFLPGEAAQLDNKVDDGSPEGGRVRAVSAISATGGGTTPDAGSDPAVSGACVNAALTPAAYNTANSEFEVELNCNLRYLTAF